MQAQNQEMKAAEKRFYDQVTSFEQLNDARDKILKKYQKQNSKLMQQCQSLKDEVLRLESSFSLQHKKSAVSIKPDQVVKSAKKAPQDE